jgi:hypothetical protein
MPLVNMSLIKTEADLEQQCLVLSKRKRTLSITHQANHRDYQQQLRHHPELHVIASIRPHVPDPMNTARSASYECRIVEGSRKVEGGRRSGNGAEEGGN